MVSIANINNEIHGAPPALVASEPVRSRSKFRITWFNDIRDNIVKESIVDGVLGVGEFTYVVGKPGSGKSALFTDIACHVGSGWPWHGRKVRHGLVVYFAAERAALTRRRMMAFRKRHGDFEVALAIVEGPLDLTTGLIDAQELIVVIRDLTEKAGMPPVWIIIDTLSRSFGGGDQNKSQDMGKFVRSADKIREETGAHLTVIHHTPWGEDRAKGAIDLDGAVDASFIVKQTAKGYTLRCDGTNDGEEGLITTFTMESVVVGVDQEGKETEAPVIVQSATLEDQEQLDGGGVKLKSPAKRKVLRVFETALAEVGQTSPKGELAVAADELKKRVGEAFNGPNVKATSLPSIVRRELNALRKSGAAEQIGEWYFARPSGSDASELTMH